ncbi:hypothetical protein [Streptomyces europaeiscabiei]|uniref:hypothetical protein n=1 Tax=Streptomyces europaeiscabiei TaxID=146819 RepID=UPI0038D4D226
MLGSSGHGVGSGFLLGSVGQQVLARAKYPVFLMRAAPRSAALRAVQAPDLPPLYGWAPAVGHLASRRAESPNRRSRHRPRRSDPGGEVPPRPGRSHLRSGTCFRRGAQVRRSGRARQARRRPRRVPDAERAGFRTR